MRLVPIKITSERMEHIHSHPGRGHIEAHEIIEVLRDPDRKIKRNKQTGAGDYLITGRTRDGKSLRICVRLKDEGQFKSELITAWEGKA